MKRALQLMCLLALPVVARGEVDYLKSVKPLLQERCYTCHGALKQKATLRLDTVAAMLKGGESGPALKRGAADASMLIKKVTATDLDERMPPLHEGEPFNQAQVSVLREWIAAGAPAPPDEKPEQDPREHWAFRSRVKPPVPAVANAKWVRNPIDSFISKQHAAHGLTPQREAPREVLLRRLYLDLIGIPPTGAEIAAVEKETGGAWYEAAVERLLSDPRHGERWARHWMDVWRYSDWWGLGDQLRNSQKHMWHWRDWIVESLNADTPYDEMVRQMLAADELYPSDQRKLRATGFLARNYFIFNRNPWMEETVEHVNKAFLALTMNCSKCHDHKYDPIAQTDYYGMRAFFEPYHVRLDVVPGATDVDRDGIPRVFDGLTDAPTYRYIRGDESKPDKSKPIAPGIPAIFAFKQLDVRPVTLPPEAWQPELQPWVSDAHIAPARKKVVAAEEALARAKKEVEAVAKRGTKTEGVTPAVDVPPKPVISTQFAGLDPTHWKLFGGEWSQQAGRLEQKKDGQTRSVLRLIDPAPRDFDATMRFTLRGGSLYRSVGITFDATTLDPSQAGTAGDSEILVYVSGHAPGPKVQAAYSRGAQAHYPADGMVTRPITLDREYTLRVRARDTLVNVELNGEPVLAWRSPLARRDGALQFTTFDALATFHEITVAPLDVTAKLREPSAKAATLPATPESTLAEAKAAQAVAEQAVLLAKAELESVTKRSEAMIAARTKAGDETAKREAAVRAELRVAAAKARHAVADAESRLLRAAATKKAGVEKELTTARGNLVNAEKAVEAPLKPDATYARLIGAKWTPTRFRDSGKDDPPVPFPQTSTGRRKALAEWIADARNPLTARVAANHIWLRHTGTPLVGTVFDFGRKGASPTHPELLDWLASELVESGWSMRHLHRLIVTSAAYRMSSSLTGAGANSAKDPDNTHFWRRTPVRLEAQVVRDSMLALSGELDVTLGGASVPPSEQDNSKRRSLYFFHSNNERNRFLTAFDEAAVKECYRRDQSIVPQQALALSNSALVQDAAVKIAARISEAAPDESGFIHGAWLLIPGIAASDAEIAASARALDAWRKVPGGSASAARAQLVGALLNHNDFVTLR